MPKNVLFWLKNCKNRQTLESLPQNPLLQAAGGSAPRSPHHSSYIVNSSLCICPQNTQTLSESIKRPYFLVIIAKVHQTFGVEKNYVAFRMPETTEFITIGFNFFCLSPHSFCASAAPARFHMKWSIKMINSAAVLQCFWWSIYRLTRVESNQLYRFTLLTSEIIKLITNYFTTNLQTIVLVP